MELSDYRKELDSIDAQMLELFKQRMNTVRGVAEYKKKTSCPSSSRAESARFLPPRGGSRRRARRLRPHIFRDPHGCQPLLSGETDRKRRRYLGNYNRCSQNTPPIFPKHGTVACQGVEGAYSQLACDKLFTAPSISYFKNFEGVFAAVEQGLCEYGILPIETAPTAR